MDKKKTGNLIREARQRKNYTQSELGKMLGVTNKAVGERGKFPGYRCPGVSVPSVGTADSGYCDRRECGGSGECRDRTRETGQTSGAAKA